MARVRNPFSGDVTQFFRIFTSSFAAMGSQFGFINLNFTQSKAPEVEEDILDRVASYGMQLGRIGDALVVLLTHFQPSRDLTEAELEALDKLRLMLNEIAAVKTAHGRAAMKLAYGQDFEARRSKAQAD
ncbi:hypothetical protein [Xanthobacter sediminis]